MPEMAGRVPPAAALGAGSGPARGGLPVTGLGEPGSAMAVQALIITPLAVKTFYL